MQQLETLHAPYADLLRAALELASPAGGRVGLDIGCGPGLKADWLAARLAPGGLLLGLDIERAALAALPPAVRRAWLVGDACDLPLAAASVDLGWCVAAQELLAPPSSALAEARRVLRPAGALVVAVVRQLWVRPRPWPVAVAAAWADRAPPPPADDLGADLAEVLADVGLGRVSLSAYLLDQPEPGLAHAALPLASWETLAPQLAAGLAPDICAACLEAEAWAEPEPMAVLLVAAAYRGV